MPPTVSEPTISKWLLMNRLVSQIAMPVTMTRMTKLMPVILPPTAVRGRPHTRSPGRPHTRSPRRPQHPAREVSDAVGLLVGVASWWA